jgi:hypothetical protein
MADRAYEPPAGFVTMAQAQARLGVSKVTLLKLLRLAGVQIYSDPFDKRVRLVKEADLAQLSRQPIPIEDAPGQLVAALAS